MDDILMELPKVGEKIFCQRPGTRIKSEKISSPGIAAPPLRETPIE
jgi:hypothetical protein